jgi:hypothetical protein
MGVSTDAILCHGIDLNTEDDDVPSFLEDFDGDFDEFLDHINGLSDAEHNVRSEAHDACPAELVRYCSREYPMHILAIRGTASKARRGSVVEIESLEVDPEAIDKFKKFCQDNDIDYGDGPKWCLVSMWG